MVEIKTNVVNGFHQIYVDGAASGKGSKDMDSARMIASGMRESLKREAVAAYLAENKAYHANLALESEKNGRVRAQYV